MRIAISFLAAIVVAGCAHVDIEPLPPVDPGPLPDGSHLALERIRTYEHGQSRADLAVVEDMVQDALKSEDEAFVLAWHLGEMLAREDVTLAGKDFVCRQLWIIGGPNNVHQIAPLLTKPETTDMARYALENIPGRRADVALIEAFDKTSGTVRIGIVNSIGEREMVAAVPRLRDLSTDPDPATAEAARAALAKIES